MTDKPSPEKTAYPVPQPPTEGSLREELAAYFLSAPPLSEQTSAQRQAYLEQLARLGRLERQEVLLAAGAARPLVWGNPVELLQALLTAAQRLAAGLGQPLMLFPAKEATIGFPTLMHPRLLSIGLTALLSAASLAAPRRPVWVRMQEQKHSLALAVTAEAPFADEDTLRLVKECTRLHGGSLVHNENTVSFSCGQVSDPPPGVRLYSGPSADELLQDTLSAVWTGYYAVIYSSLMKSKEEKSSAGDSPASEEDTGSP